MKSNFIRNLTLLLLSVSLFNCSEEEIYPTGDPQILNAVEILNKDSLRVYNQWLQDMQPRFMLAQNHRSIAFQIKNKFEKLGLTNTQIDSFEVSLEYDNQNISTWQYNIISTISGHQNSDSICIVAAHYDSNNEQENPFISSPGADDNGSGMAAILEIARCLKSEMPNPKYTIRFIAFAGEELDLYGSRNYAQKAKSRGEKIKMMLNNDMIGYTPDFNPDNWYVNIMYYNNSKDLFQTAERICSQYTRLQPENNNKYNDEGDSYAFFQQGFKSLFIIEDTDNPDYHTSNDVISNINFDYCREVAKISYAMLLEANR